jgi:sortase A
MRRIGALVVVALLGAAACGGSGSAASTTTAVVEDPIPRTTLPATTLAPTTIATTTIPLTPQTSVAAAAPTTALPTPVAPPAEDAKEPLQTLGEISIPKLKLDDKLYEGVALSTLDNGPGHWPGTAMPGQAGNVVVAGHRVSHSKPFRYIDQLQAGDEVDFTVNGATYTYVVTSHEIVDPTAIRIVDQTPEPTATLFACHPPGSTAERYVVHLALKS